MVPRFEPKRSAAISTKNHCNVKCISLRMGGSRSRTSRSAVVPTLTIPALSFICHNNSALCNYYVPYNRSISIGVRQNRNTQTKINSFSVKKLSTLPCYSIDTIRKCTAKEKENDCEPSRCCYRTISNNMQQFHSYGAAPSKKDVVKDLTEYTVEHLISFVPGGEAVSDLLKLGSGYILGMAFDDESEEEQLSIQDVLSQLDQIDQKISTTLTRQNTDVPILKTQRYRKQIIQPSSTVVIHQKI